MKNQPARRKIVNPYPELAGYNCFGCSPSNTYGLQMEFFEEGDFITAYWEPIDHFSGYKKVLHGGIQSTLLDEIASWAVQIKLKTAGVTAGIDLRFKKPVFVDRGILRLRAQILSVERKIASVQTELFDSDDELCCTGIVKYFIYPPDIARLKLSYPEYDKFFTPEPY